MVVKKKCKGGFSLDRLDAWLVFNHCVTRGRDPSDWLGLGHEFTSRKGAESGISPTQSTEFETDEKGSHRKILAQFPGEREMDIEQVKRTCIHCKYFPTCFPASSLWATLSSSCNHSELVNYTLESLTLLLVDLWCLEVKV